MWSVPYFCSNLNIPNPLVQYLRQFDICFGNGAKRISRNPDLFREWSEADFPKPRFVSGMERSGFPETPICFGNGAKRISRNPDNDAVVQTLAYDLFYRNSKKVTTQVISDF